MSAFTGVARTLRLAGLPLITVGSFVNGFTPGRSSVAGVCFAFSLIRLGIVISPGPGRPERARDAGVSLDALRHAEVPVLGVCLGHQAIGVEYGGTVDRTEPVHGKASKVFHEGRGILEGVHDPFEAGRYHSLVVERDDLPDSLELTAWTEDGLVMATQHRELPQFGVQFHPESILTPEGPTIVRTFLALTT